MLYKLDLLDGKNKKNKEIENESKSIPLIKNKNQSLQTKPNTFSK